MEMSNAIAEMDLSNLTDEQIAVMIKLAWFAEDGFDQAAEKAINDTVRKARTKQAGQSMVLRNRLGQEKEKREASAKAPRESNTVVMDILRVTPIIADMHESGLYATKHNNGEFDDDKQRWFAAAADCGVVGDEGIAMCWKLYLKSVVLTMEAA